MCDLKPRSWPCQAMAAALKSCFEVPAVLEDSCLQIVEGVLPQETLYTWLHVESSPCHCRSYLNKYLRPGLYNHAWGSIYLCKIEFGHPPKSQYYSEWKGKNPSPGHRFSAILQDQGIKLWGSASCSQAANTLTSNHYFELDCFSWCPCVPNFTKRQAW